MTKELRAIFENGILRPLEPLELEEHQHVIVTVSDSEDNWLDTEYMESCANGSAKSVTLQSVREALSKIPGSLTDDFMRERDDR